MGFAGQSTRFDLAALAGSFAVCKQAVFALLAFELSAPEQIVFAAHIYWANIPEPEPEPEPELDLEPDLNKPENIQFAAHSLAFVVGALIDAGPHFLRYAIIHHPVQAQLFVLFVRPVPRHYMLAVDMIEGLARRFVLCVLARTHNPSKMARRFAFVVL